jgi:hypothetical protein
MTHPKRGAACAKVTILGGGSGTTVALPNRPVFSQQWEKSMSKHDSVTKRKRRPKSDKRVDYTARTMAIIKEHSEAAKLSQAQSVVPKTA